MKGRERAELRAEAHHLTATVHVGQQGLSDSLLKSLDDALRTRELVKVKLGGSSESSSKAIAGELAAKSGAMVVQVIGRTVTLYRHNSELPRKDTPPWR